MKQAKKPASGRFMIALGLLLQTAACGLLLLTLRVDRLKTDGNAAPATAVGILFWVLLALSLLVLLLCSAKRRRLERESGSGEKQLPGLFRFFRNKPAAVVDILFFLALLAAAAGFIFKLNDVYLLCAIVACLILFCFHCWFNGKNYRFFIDGQKEKSNKQKKERQTKSKERTVS